MQKNNFFLVGLPGVGKTTLAKKLANKLNLRFIDTDKEIIRYTGATISMIFDIEGEEGFRKRESFIIKKFSNLSNIVLATGGGSILKPENRKYLQTRGIVIYLHSKPEVLFERMLYDKKRPLLQGVNIKEKYLSLYKERNGLYKSIADIEFIVDTYKSISSSFSNLLSVIINYEPKL